METNISQSESFPVHLTNGELINQTIPDPDLPRPGTDPQPTPEPLPPGTVPEPLPNPGTEPEPPIEPVPDPEGT